MSAPYHGYRSESEYHEHHTLLALLEVETDAAERRLIEGRIQEIEATNTPHIRTAGGAA